MSGANLDVRPFTSRDEYAAMVDYFVTGGDDFLRGMGIDVDKVPAREDWLDAVWGDHARSDREKERLFVAWRVDGTLIGHSSLSHIEFGKCAHFHLHVWEPSLRRSGLGARFVADSVDLYFERFELETIACEPFADNPGPNRLLRKLGFDLTQRYRTTPTAICFEQWVHRYEVGRAAWRVARTAGAT